MEKKDAVLMGPFAGELYWEAGRFAPMLPWFIRKKYKNRDITYIILTRKERFDLYGKFADIVVPLRIPGDYDTRQPECFKLKGLKSDYMKIVNNFRKKYSKKFNIVEHVYPNVTKPHYLNKNQFHRSKMIYLFKPRNENYRLVEKYLPEDKPWVVLAPRYRKGFKRNWGKWQQFYDMLYKDKELMDEFNFIICGKTGEYIPDKHNRFFDMNHIKITERASLVGVLLVIMKKAFFTFGSQSAIPNISLLHGVEVLEFGCQKSLHTRTYNVTNTRITFIENRRYDIDPGLIMKQFKKLLRRKKGELKNGKRMVKSKQTRVRSNKKSIA